MHRGKQLTIYKGDKAAEDERWVYITEVKENGTKAYLCILCNKSFVGHCDKIIAHFLQRGGLCQV